MGVWFRSLFIVRYLRWRFGGRSMVKYPGFKCGCCGRWWDIPFEIPEYESCGEWADTWGLCPRGEGCNTIYKDGVEVL